MDKTIEEINYENSHSCRLCVYNYKPFGFDNLCHCKKSEHFGKEIIGDGIPCNYLWSIICCIIPEGITYQEASAENDIDCSGMRKK